MKKLLPANSLRSIYFFKALFFVFILFSHQAFSQPCTPPTVNNPSVLQPTCALPSGAITIFASSSSGSLEYSIDNGTTWQGSPIFSGLAPGSYNLVVRIAANPSCQAPYGSNPVNINALPAPPTINSLTVTQPTCAVPSGTIVINATGIGTLEYSINGTT